MFEYIFLNLYIIEYLQVLKRPYNCFGKESSKKFSGDNRCKFPAKISFGTLTSSIFAGDSTTAFDS